jgi:hypothetical protein
MTSRFQIALKLAACVLLFFGVGEVVVRLDQSIGFFQGERHVVVGRNLRDTPELRAVQAGTLGVEPGDIRVMVLGDSYIQGGGIPPDRRLASQLGALLRSSRELAGRRVIVLDASSGGSNAYDHWRHYFSLVERFQPVVVLLAYNNNDVYGLPPEASNPAAPAGGGTANTGREGSVPAGETSLARMQAFKRVLFQAEVVKFLIQQVNLQLRTRGVVVAGTEFHHLVRKAYADESASWRRTRAYLSEISADARRRGAVLVAYNVPEFNIPSSTCWPTIGSSTR